MNAATKASEAPESGTHRVASSNPAHNVDDALGWISSLTSEAFAKMGRALLLFEEIAHGDAWDDALAERVRGDLIESRQALREARRWTREARRRPERTSPDVEAAAE